jgi:hypothetical protein
MRFRSVWLILVPVVFALAVTGVLVARHAGTSSPTAPDLSTPGVKACPSGTPDACHELMAQLLHIDARDLPSIAENTRDLHYRKGFVFVSNTRNEAPTVVLEYGLSSGQSESETYHVTFGVRTAPKQDRRPVGTTPGHRTFRIVRTALGTIGLVFNDEHLGYVVGRGIGANLNQTPADLARAEQVVDAVGLSTRQLNPTATR